MDKISLLHSLEDLVSTKYESDFRSHISDMLSRYLDIVKELDENCRPEQWSDILNNITILTKMIKECIKRVYMGQHSSAYNLFRKRMNEVVSFPGVIGTIPANTDFYRMRVFDSDDETPSRKGLFHIPFDKRGVVKTERYSTPGYPCLYLGLSSYVCWEEMNRPNLDKCFVSRVRLDKSIDVINLSMPEEQYWNDDIYIMGCLHKFPLIISSMVLVRNKKDVFKPEYIIPQLLMEWLLERLANKKDKSSLVGVFYSSVHNKHGLNFPNYVFKNLAIPAQSPFQGKLSKELCDLFSITEPTSEELENAKGSMFDGSNIFMPITSKEENIIRHQKYQRSLFGTLERMLKKEDFELKKLDYK